MIDGNQLLAKAGKRLGEIRIMCVRFDDTMLVISHAEAQHWLAKMTFFDDASHPEWPADPTPPGRRFGFQAWTDERLWWSSSEDGVAILMSRPLTPLAWLTAETDDA